MITTRWWLPWSVSSNEDASSCPVQLTLLTRAYLFLLETLICFGKKLDFFKFENKNQFSLKQIQSNSLNFSPRLVFSSRIFHRHLILMTS